MTQENKPSWEKLFDKEFTDALNAREFSWQNHGGEPWKGKTIQDFIRESIIKEIIEDSIPDGVWQNGDAQIDMNNLKRILREKWL